MDISNRKLVLAALAASLTFVGSQALAAPSKSQGAGGWEPSADHLESVVITVQSNPVSGYDPDPEDLNDAWEALAQSAEPACVALQIGINLLMDTVPSREGPAAVVPVDGVILFPTVDGIELVNPANGTPGGDDGPLNEPVCTTPAGPATGTLNGLLQAFVGAGGQVLSCPLCAGPRLMGESPNFGGIADGEEVLNLFLYADKVIDF